MAQRLIKLIPENILISPKERMIIIDDTLRQHYRETFERKRVPSDYLLMFTEGGESDAIADEAARYQAKRLMLLILQLIESIENTSWRTNAGQFRKFHDVDWRRFRNNLQEVMSWLKE